MPLPKGYNSGVVDFVGPRPGSAPTPRVGKTTGVLCDGSDGPAGTFIPLPGFVNAPSSIEYGFSNCSDVNAQLGGKIVGNPTAAGFFILITGGLGGVTCDLNWSAYP